VKGNYERDKTPDPFRYYVEDYPYYGAYHPQLTIIPSSIQDYPTTLPPASEVPRMYKCDLCITCPSNIIDDIIIYDVNLNCI
jgi:hypothetical protein